MILLHFTRGQRLGAVQAVAWGACLIGAAILGAHASAQAQDTSVTQSTYTIYLRGQPIGNETVTVNRTSAGWTISSSGRSGLPIDLTTRRLQLHYTPEWKPIDLSIDATFRGALLSGRTTVAGTSAQSGYDQAGQTIQRTDQIAADAVLLINPLWAPFEALSQRLKDATPGSSIPAYTLGSAFSIQVGAGSTETLQMGAETFRARRTTVTMPAAGSLLVMEIWSQDDGRLMRVSIPAQNLEVVRDDIASVAVRVVKVSRPNDEELRIPANGFRLAGTISKPVTVGPKDKLPAVILVGGAGPTDWDELQYGVPIFGQLADTLADAGFIVLRYDKRGAGQSGGREESATLTDFTDDLLAAVSAVRKLPAVDRNRLAVIGYGEGGSIAMLAASRERDIGALALVGTMASTGAELNMWRVRHNMERSTRSAAERQETIELQQRIHQAVISGTGWDTIPPEYRQADIPWFKSFLIFDPPKVMNKISQPILVVQGLLDRQVPPEHADRLEELAKLRKKPSVEVVRIPDINHLLLQAKTGEMDEYTSFRNAHVSPAVGTALVGWLNRTLAPEK